jgi:hypothetical protein
MPRISDRGSSATVGKEIVNHKGTDGAKDAKAEKGSSLRSPFPPLPPVKWIGPEPFYRRFLRWRRWTAAMHQLDRDRGSEGSGSAISELSAVETDRDFTADFADGADTDL